MAAPLFAIIDRNVIIDAFWVNPGPWKRRTEENGGAGKI